MTPEDRHKRARVAALSRHRPSAAETVALAQEFKAERLADHIRRIVDQAPALTPEQRDRLAALLRTTP
jgi:hypothetical protein